MRSIEQIIADNGYDNTPIGDSHNLTGRALPEGVEGDWTPFEADVLTDDDFSYAPLATFDELAYLDGAILNAVSDFGLGGEALVALPEDACE